MRPNTSEPERTSSVTIVTTGQPVVAELRLPVTTRSRLRGPPGQAFRPILDIIAFGTAWTRPAVNVNSR